MNDEAIRWLQNIPLFAGLNEEQLSRLVAAMRRVQLDAGQRLFEQGQAAERFYVVETGQIKLYRLSADGQEKVIEIVHPEQPFAEAVAFMEAEEYPVNSEALMDPTVVLGFRNEDLRELLRSSPDACFRLIGNLSRRLHQLVAEIDKLTLHDATYRLVGYLMSEVPDKILASPMIRLTTPKQTIASRLSIKPETFSRILARLEQQGLIQVERNEIVVRDLEGLKRLVER